ncbi:MAG TPA: hypothetical protein VFU88_11755 [Ktedonobacterales bacterium]|nr:hypothetical protein [Ktedonobacterales bacterium]
MVATTPLIGSPPIYEVVPPDAAERLHAVSRDVYAPVLAAFARRCLSRLRGRPDMINLCLARDGISAFLAQRALLHADPRRFHGIAPGQVRLAYVSRQLIAEARWSLAMRALLAEYLRAQGLAHVSCATLVDVGIHGSIQDELQRLFPDHELRGEYLLYRRCPDDANASRKRGFLVGDAAGGASGNGGGVVGEWACFLRRGAIHLLEDTWSGLHESVTALRVSAGIADAGTERRVRAALEPLGARTPISLPRLELARLKRVALQGVVEGVARAARHPPRSASDLRQRIARLAEWVASTSEPDSPDAWLWRTIIRQRRESERTWDSFDEE